MAPFRAGNDTWNIMSVETGKHNVGWDRVYLPRALISICTFISKVYLSSILVFHILAIECTPLKNLDANVILSPPRCQSGKNFFNEECKVECKPGYELDQASAQKLKCLYSGFVSVHGNMPKCRRELFWLSLSLVCRSFVVYSFVHFFDVLLKDNSGVGVIYDEIKDSTVVNGVSYFFP